MKNTANDTNEKRITRTWREACEDLYCEAVNYERFKPDLKDMPHERFSDLAVIYYFEKKSGSENKIIPLTREMIRKTGRSEEELRDAAWKNTIRKKRAVMMPLSEVLGGESGEDAPALFVLTNENMHLGAVTMLYPDLMDLIAEKMDSDIFIIPSSIHECLLLPDRENITAEELRDLVKRVNDTEVEDDEILSYNIYKYSRIRRAVIIDNEQNAMLSLTANKT